MTSKTPSLTKDVLKSKIPDALQLSFIEKVEKGLEQLHSGNVLTHEQVKQRVKQWQK